MFFSWELNYLTLNPSTFAFLSPGKLVKKKEEQEKKEKEKKEKKISPPIMEKAVEAEGPKRCKNKNYMMSLIN